MTVEFGTLDSSTFDTFRVGVVSVFVGVSVAFAAVVFLVVVRRK
tara:strand:+ start:180 stop:311 length:132 start_codon:yes stop_codon:yes gene_type:complete